ncbi:hypothetical protein BBO99_00006676 [Phytophthora kernoviae]|uniref:Uncharacterized protein n=2 Tax=Phytophthora kernoviae TaxID=325452 RepID=A0A3R7MR97_9STRA|nr:hypothetical protein G195_010814 [Phytophthora kernoviae 00238/432]KAG2506961.1 hypothetical protein JM16_009074 [Phytophthora kernoviae]KAG2509547.1 hypothetical protein JM18_009094 [Phytophthora kernoviae]RLN26301.1 hypothetical protein BBI17_009307 [Phytophthora kernoviae]RLN77523.1 hypothetical protein BBO99_00006676 [Phytophthora kernoviae]
MIDVDVDATPATAPELMEAPEPSPKRTKTETTARTCQFCSNKKQIAASCVSGACKKCCLARPEPCATHPKEIEKAEVEPPKSRKPVLKNEFRETNFHYYGETVTIFCIKDFFTNKKLSQGVLNDQERDERVSGKTWGRRKKKSAQNSDVKAQIQSALGKRSAPADSSSDKPLAVPAAVPKQVTVTDA